MRSIAFSTTLLVFLGLSTASAVSKNKTMLPEISKESYLPSAHEISLLGRVNFVAGKSSITGPSGNVLERKNSDTDLTLKISYGFSDNLSFGLQDKYLISRKQDVSYGPGSSSNGTSESTKSSGIEEPEFFGTFRFYENDTSNVRIHLTGSLSPKIQTATYATTAADGNAGTGGNRYRLGATVYKVIESVEISFGLIRSLIELNKSEDSSNSQKITEHSEYQTTEVDIGVLKAVNDSLVLGVALGIMMNEGYKATGYTGNQITSSANYDSASATALALVAKYKLTESSLIAADFITLLNYSQSVSAGSVKLNVGDASSNSIRTSWQQTF